MPRTRKMRTRSSEGKWVMIDTVLLVHETIPLGEERKEGKLIGETIVVVW